MTRQRGRGAQQVMLVLRRSFGSGTALVIGFTVIVLVAVEWLATGLLGLAIHALRPWLGGYAPLVGNGLLVLFALLVFVFVWAYFRRYKGPPRFVAYEEEAVVRCTVVVVLLSAHPADRGRGGETTLSLDEFSGLAPLAPDRPLAAHNAALRNWRMPLESVRVHVDHLRKVVVVHSSGENGSTRQFPVFQALLQGLVKGRNIDVIGMEALDPSLADGCDFDSVESVWRALERVWEGLRSDGPGAGKVSSKNIMVDVTGGNKLASVAAALFTQSQDRWFEYLSTVGADDGSVRVSTIDVIPDDERP